MEARIFKSAFESKIEQKCYRLSADFPGFGSVTTKAVSISFEKGESRITL